MKDLKGTKTLENLLIAFAGEFRVEQVYLLRVQAKKMVTSRSRLFLKRQQGMKKNMQSLV